MSNPKVKPRDKPHYVNNADFSAAVCEYVGTVIEAKKQNAPIPIVTDYIATCFLKISEGLSHKANFVRYTYREEMVMDAVENCLKAIENYNLDAATRTGKPNAFAYFTQISWFAFLRRIQKEKRQQDIKLRYLSQSGIEQLVYMEMENDPASRQTLAFIDELRDRIDLIKHKDLAIKSFGSSLKRERKKRSNGDSDLSEFLINEEEGDNDDETQLLYDTDEDE